MAEKDALEAIADIAVDAGLPPIAEAARSAAARLRAGLFYVVCVGQFKRGKSTLLNALVGTDVLPTGVVPVTSTVTILRHGPRLGARVRFAGGDWQETDARAIDHYVSEQHNPGNVKGVVAVEVTVSSPLLERGLCLVDTPGIGSVNLANSDATRAFIPHVDAALLVLGSDPPITADELGLVDALAGSVRDIIVVFNKADRQSGSERAEALGFTERVLAKALRRDPGPILQVSATEHLSGGDDARDWPALLERLTILARGSGGALVATARRREAATLTARLGSSLEEQRAALLRPIEQSERHAAAVRATVADAERILVDLRHLLNAEQERLVARFTDERDRFLKSACAAAEEELQKAIGDDPRPAWPLRAHALEQAQAITRRTLDRWRGELEPRAAALYREAERRFVELVNGVRERLLQLRGLENLAHVDSAAGFRVKSGVYYIEMLRVAPTSPATWLLDHVLPRWRRRAAQEAASEYQQRLLEVNSARVKNDFEDRLTESRRALEREIREVLNGLVASAETALDEARRAHAAGAAAVRARLEMIDMLRKRLEALRCDVQERPGFSLA